MQHICRKRVNSIKKPSPRQNLSVPTHRVRMLWKCRPLREKTDTTTW